MITAQGAFPVIMTMLAMRFADQGENVNVGEWQGQRDGRPQTRTIELEDVYIETGLHFDVPLWQAMTGPNLPWAEEHFQERVSGKPLNPPPSHERWPFAQAANEEHRPDGKFSHTYPERFWPKWAGEEPAHTGFNMRGIRFEYGDLGNLLHMLQERKATRQAYLPVWFPEDLYAADVVGERVPCTLGYHFLVRNNRVNVKYFIRSCDFNRHFRDDAYMAGRLAMWIAERIDAQPGKLNMMISSLHIFEDEGEMQKAEAKRTLAQNLASNL